MKKFSSKLLVIISLAQMASLLWTSNNCAQYNIIPLKPPISSLTMDNNSNNEKIAFPFKKIPTAKLSAYSEHIKAVNNSLPFSYQLTIGDSKEFIEFSSITRNTFSIKQGVLKDTILSNSLSYKKIEWSNLANSVVDTPRYEYQRIDSSGKVYIFINNEDRLLYDFARSTGDTYNSPYDGLIWKVTDKYNVVGFTDTLNAIDLDLIDENFQVWRQETIIEKFGLIYYLGNTSKSYQYLKGQFWGALLNNTRYNELLAFDLKQEWDNFYPLNIGDVWKYKYSLTPYTFGTTINEVIKDSILFDGLTYKKIKTTHYYPSFTGSIIFNRIDSAGNIFDYIPGTSLHKSYKLSACVGDTSYDSWKTLYRIEGKTGGYDSLYRGKTTKLFIKSIRSLTSDYAYFVRGLGIVESGGEASHKFLSGAIINGISYGDTAYITSISDERKLIVERFELFQNFPNPFNSSTKIKYYLSETAYVILEIFSICGEKVAELINSEQNYGLHEILWNGKGSNEHYISSGIYFYRVRVVPANGTATTLIKKLTILK